MTSPLTRSDDLDQLRHQHVRVPAVFRRGSWLAFPLSTGFDIGPGATQLLLFLPVAAADEASGREVPSWFEVEEAVGAPRGPTSRTVPAAAAALLLDGLVDLDAEPMGDRWTVRGVECPVDAFGSVFWRHGWALATSAGLLVSLVSG